MSEAQEVVDKLVEENEHLKHIMKSHDQVCAEALGMVYCMS